MRVKEEVLNALNNRLDVLTRKTEQFEKYGNKHDRKDLMEQAIAISCRHELLMLKNDLLYTIDWGLE